MAKKAYKVHDDMGRAWLVKPGDPAFPLVSKLKYPEPVLPFLTLRTGVVHSALLTAAHIRVERFTKACTALPEDDEMAAALRRAVSLQACLRELVDATITEA